MYEGSRFDRCRWRGCQAECVDEIELCWYHFRLAGEAFIESRSIFGSAALAERKAEREAAEAARRAALPDPDEWRRKRSVVYYVRIVDHVKIGYTIHLPSRIHSLRVDRSAVLAVEPGWREIEAERHATFAAERVSKRENFNPSRRLLAHIDLVRSKYGEPFEYASRRVTLAGPEPVAA